MFAMSSISEGYSIALLEACACALPIAATRVGANAEIVADDVNGLVVPPSDPEALAAAIGQLLGDPGRASAMGRAGRSWLLSNATFDEIGRANVCTPVTNAQLVCTPMP